MKIVVLDGYTENPGDLSWSELEALGELSLHDRTPFDDNEIQKRIGDAEIILTNKVPISRATIENCTNIKYIGVLATGYNIIDVNAANERNIPICNIPTYGTVSVSQFAFALLLEICHHVGHHGNAVRDGRWENCIDWCFWDYPLIELAEKTMGIIGFGRIGQATAAIAKSFGMRVIAYDAHQSDAGRALAEYTSLDELLSQSDVISLHCPLFPETEGIINKESIAKMKQSVILINTSRGPLVVEQDLADALNSGRVFAAGVDVVSSEPIKGDNPLLKAKNCIITPHIAWAPKESRKRLMDVAINNVKGFLSGDIINRVN